MHVNTMYPNLPDDFRTQIKIARVERQISQRQMAHDLFGQTNAATISQFETGKRSISYTVAVKIRDYLKMDYELPLPRPEDVEPITRNRRKSGPLLTDRFYIILDEELIEVVSYRKLGSVHKALRVFEDLA